MRRNILLCVLTVLLYSCNEQTETNEARLHRFYTWYVKNAANAPSRWELNQDTLKEYCSPSFLKNIFSDSALDYDPLLSADKFNERWAENITIANGAKGSAKVYRIHFIKDKAHHSHNILATMSKERGFWKIDYVEDIK